MTAAVSPAVAEVARPDASPPGAVLIDETAVRSADAIVTEVLVTAGRMHGAGVHAGDRVLVKGGNSASYVLDLLALMHLDTSIVLVDHQLTAADTAAAARRAGARWLLRNGCLELASRKEAGRAGEGGSAPGTDRLDLDNWFRRPDAAVLWSSGTTGPAKGIVKSGPAILDNTRRTLAVMEYRPEDVLAPWLPFSHQYGMSLILLWWLTGCSLVVTPYQRLATAMEQSARHGATVVDATPATYHAVLRIFEFQPRLRASLSSVRMWCVGGAPLPAPLDRAFREATGQPLLDGYGLTELGNVALATPDNPVGCGYPLPGVDVRIVAADRTPVPAGELGEIEVRSDGQLAGHLGPGGAVRPVPPRTWYRTRDLGWLDTASRLHVVGRRRAVHRHGYTLYPEWLERKAERCGRPVKVIATEDTRRGATLTFVVADPDLRDVRFWRDRINDLLPTYERPNAVRVVDRFPVNANGKVDLAALGRLLDEAD